MRMSPQDCARFLGHLVDHNSVSRDLPSFRWHPSTQAASLAMATKYPSRDFVLVPLCTGPTFCATCASSRSHGHLLLTSQRRSSHRRQHFEELSVYLCRHLSFKFRHTERNCCRCDRVLRLHCKRQSSTCVREHT